MDVKDAIKNRYSVRQYNTKPVPREIVWELMEAAWHAPSSCNLQLMHYVIVDDKVLQERLAKIATSKLLWAPTNIIFLIDPRFTKKRNSAIMGLGAAMQNISLAAVSYGLATCPMAGFEGDVEMKKILGIPDILEPVLIMGLGYPEGKTKKRNRIPLSEMVHVNSFNLKETLLNASPRLSDWTIEEIKNYRQRIAPVYRYNDRFSLHIYSNSVYEEATGLFKTYLKDGLNFLDLFTYDAAYYRSLQKLDLRLKTSIADYDLYSLQENKDLGDDIKTIEIGNDNELNIESGSQDRVTMVHKLQFTPQRKKIFNEIARVLKKDGLLFVTVDQEGLLKRLAIKARLIMKKIVYGETYNVYENSLYYKIGPYQFTSAQEIDQLASLVGLKKIQSGTRSVSNSGRLNHRLYYAIFSK